MSNIVLKRGGGYADMFRAYEVLIDGEVRGLIRRNEVQTFEVAQGAHEVQLKIDWCSSPVFEIDAAKDDTRLTCGPNVNPLLVAFAFTKPGEWIWLRRSES